MTIMGIRSLAGCTEASGVSRADEPKHKLRIHLCYVKCTRHIAKNQGPPVVINIKEMHNILRNFSTCGCEISEKPKYQPHILNGTEATIWPIFWQSSEVLRIVQICVGTKPRTQGTLLLREQLLCSRSSSLHVCGRSSLVQDIWYDTWWQQDHLYTYM